MLPTSAYNWVTYDEAQAPSSSTQVGISHEPSRGKLVCGTLLRYRVGSSAGRRTAWSVRLRHFQQMIWRTPCIATRDND